MPAQFTKSFAGRLNELSPMYVKEAENGDAVKKMAQVLIAPGNFHMLLKRKGEQIFCGDFIKRARWFITSGRPWMFCSGLLQDLQGATRWGLF